MSEQAESSMTTLFECVRKCDRVASPVICDRKSYTRKIESGLRSNLLVALQLIIERDPEIPSPCVWCATPTTKIIGAVPGVSVGNPECGC